MNPKYFQDLRHAKRLAKVVRVLSEHPSESVPEATSSASESQSIDRFWSNQQAKSSQILESHRAAVVARGQRAGVVLAIQDS